MDAIQHNITEVKENLEQRTKILLVVKADAYGHGAAIIAQNSEYMECLWGFGVATFEEAMELRNYGIQKKILILGGIFPDQYEAIVRNNLSVTIYHEKTARELGGMGEKIGKMVDIHIKLDTGMGRLGFSCKEKDIQSICQVHHLEGINIEGIFTHFSTADEMDKTLTKSAYYTFIETVSKLENMGVIAPVVHCANSATAIDMPEMGLDMVRLGIGTYGLYPSQEVKRSRVELAPALSWHSKIISIKELEQGMTVSYGATFKAPKNMKIAAIPIGYADGYPRSLSTLGHVLIHGKKAPILGRICMDQCMIDISHIPEAKVMSPVILIGRDGKEGILVEDLANISGKFNYEFICGIGKRIPRNYLKRGEIIEQVDFFKLPH